MTDKTINRRALEIALARWEGEGGRPLDKDANASVKADEKSAADAESAERSDRGSGRNAQGQRS